MTTRFFCLLIALIFLGLAPGGRRVLPSSDGVIVVIACTLRADQTSPYGAPERVSPFLSRMAREGVLVEELIATAPWTRPAVMALLTGQHALALGTTEPEAGLNTRALPARVRTLAESFKERGYLTYGFTANPNVNAVFGLAQGFDSYWEGSGLWREGRSSKVSGDEVVGELVRVLSRHPADTPFFAQLVLLDAHAPDQSTEAEAELFREPGLPEAVARYRARVRRLDRSLASLWSRLEAWGWSERVTLIVVGDHGEGLSFPVGSGPGHGNYLNRSVLHVPWLMMGPDLPARTRLKGLVSGLDFFSTLSGLFDLTPGGRGVDLSADLTQPTARVEAFAHTHFGESDRAARFTRLGRCVKDYRPETTAMSSMSPLFTTGCSEGDLRQLDALDRWRERMLKQRAQTERAELNGQLLDGLRSLGYLTPEEESR